MLTRLLFIVSLVTLITGISAWTPVQAGGALVVHSYHKTYEWAQEINENLEIAFKINNIPLKYFYIDNKQGRVVMNLINKDHLTFKLEA